MSVSSKRLETRFPSLSVVCPSMITPYSECNPRALQIKVFPPLRAGVVLVSHAQLRKLSRSWSFSELNLNVFPWFWFSGWVLGSHPFPLNTPVYCQEFYMSREWKTQHKPPSENCPDTCLTASWSPMCVSYLREKRRERERMVLILCTSVTGLWHAQVKHYFWLWGCFWMT